MQKIKKKTIKKFGKEYFLLGIRKEDNKKVWLENFSWDCGWYWGGGYIEVFNRNYTDIQEHTHFDSLFLGDPANDFWNYFKATTLTDKEIWRLLDLMRQFYILRDCAEVFQYGGHLSSERTKEEINKRLAKRINKHIETVIIPLVRKLLGV